MTLLEQLERVVMADEGRRPLPYQDTRGHWTVGYGHNLTAGPLSDAAMLQILRDDLTAAETACLTLPFWGGLSAARQGALLQLTFNEGFSWVAKNPHMVAALHAGDYAGAAAALLDGPYAQQVGARATRIATQLATDAWT